MIWLPDSEALQINPHGLAPEVVENSVKPAKGCRTKNQPNHHAAQTPAATDGETWLKAMQTKDFDVYTAQHHLV